MAGLLVLACVKACVGFTTWWAVRASLPARPPAALPSWLHAVELLVFAASGLVLAIGGRRDRRSQALGVVFVLLASMFADPLLARAALVRSRGLSIVTGVGIATQPAAFLPLMLWLFVRDFPHARSHLDRWLSPAAFIMISAWSGAALFLVNLVPLAIERARVWAEPVLARGSGWFWLIVVLLMLPAVALMMARTRNALENERRRVRLFVFGWLVGLLPTGIEIILTAAVPPVARYVQAPAHFRALGYVLSAFFLVIPVTTAYAVLVERVFDVGFFIRRAIQYALARYSVGALLAAPAAFLAVFVYRNRARPLSEIFLAEPAWTWALAVIAAAVLLLLRRPLLRGIDRRFFREHYDAQQILTGLARTSRKAASSRDLAALVAGEVDRALHLERIAVVLRDEPADVFRDPTGALPPLAARSSLAMLIGGAGVPLAVDSMSAGSPLQRLPEAERQWLADVGAQLFVPFLAGDERLLGILLLGDKLSGVPFTTEDQMLLTNAVSSAAPVLEHRLRVESGGDLGGSPPADEGEAAAGQCVRCGKVQERSAPACSECGGPLADAVLPLVLKAKFRVDRQVGAGGMGVVYRARDLALHREVALKSLPRVSPTDAGRLRREARLMASLQQPNLAVIHGLEVWRGVPVLVLEYLSGGTLADRLRARALQPQEVIDLGLAMAGALHQLHRAGLLHRDVKPSNIGFTADGVPKLLDFGLARLVGCLPAMMADDTTASAPSGPTWRGRLPVDEAVDETFHTRAHQLVGTTAYLSPEAVTFQPPDPSFDLWGLALTMYEALTRTNPFAGRDRFDTVHRIVSTDAPDLGRLLPGCPKSLAAFFKAALSHALGERPSTAVEFSARLRASLSDLAQATTETAQRV